MSSIAEQPFFSVIVPCYNVGCYVDEMVESVRAQGFSDWECLLSVERSDDDTLHRCEAVAHADARFTVLFGERSGSASVPRNRALAVARGRYIVWLDGDDCLAAGALARLADVVRTAGEPDVIQYVAEEREEDADGRIVKVSRVFNFSVAEEGHLLTGEDAMCAIARLRAKFFPMPWLMAMRTDFVREHALTFIPGIRFEDAEWMPRVLYAARRVFVEGVVCYLYRHRRGSVTTGGFSVRELAFFVQVERSLFRFHATHPFSRRLSEAWARVLLSEFFRYFFEPGRIAAITASDWSACLKSLWRDGGRRDFLTLVRFAGRVKRLSAPLVLLCGIHPILDFPARAFFRFVYWPLVGWQVRRRGA